MTALSRQVGADENDSYDYAGTQNDTRTIVYHNYTTAAALISGHRFTNVTIGQGDLIESASVQTKAVTTALDDISYDLYAEAADNSGVIEGGTQLNARTKTTAAVNWTALAQGTGFVTSPDIKDVIQEVVDRGGWASGNALTILGDDPQSTYAGASVDYSGTAASAAKLDVVHTAGGVPPIASQRLKSGTGR